MSRKTVSIISLASLTGVMVLPALAVTYGMILGYSYTSSQQQAAFGLAFFGTIIGIAGGIILSEVLR